MSNIGIIGAMDEEIAFLLEKIPVSVTIKRADLEFYIGEYNEIPVVIVRSGIGKVNAAICTQMLISTFNVTHVINTGVAGGLAAGLHLLDLVVSHDAMYHDVDVTAFGYPIGTIPRMATSIFTADTALIRAVQKVHAQQNIQNTLVEGRIISGDIFVASDEKKQFIEKNFNAVCVEMEGAAIAHVCAINAVPFVILRCISDLADKSAEMKYEELVEKAVVVSAHVVLGVIDELKGIEGIYEKV